MAQVAKKELKLECDYVYEARCQSKFVELIEEDADFKGIMHVPEIIPELCSHSVLTSEWVPGVHIDKVQNLPSAFAIPSSSCHTPCQSKGIESCQSECMMKPLTALYAHAFLNLAFLGQIFFCSVKLSPNSSLDNHVNAIGF